MTQGNIKSEEGKDVWFDKEAGHELWINQERTELFAIVLNEEDRDFVILKVGDAGYKAYPGIWAVYDYCFMNLEEVEEWKTQHEEYVASNPVPLEIIPYSKKHDLGEPLVHGEIMKGWELTYGDYQFSDKYNLESFLDSFRDSFNKGGYGNEKLTQLRTDLYFRPYSDKDNSKLYVTLPTEDYTCFIVAWVGDAGYDGYPGIWGIYDYWFVKSSEMIEFRRQYDRYGTFDSLEGVLGARNHTPFEIRLKKNTIWK